MQKTLISIFIPVCNAGIFLRPSLESILCQTYDELEIIIIDDGSTDDCMSTIADIQDRRIRILHQKNSGKSVAINKALKIAKGDFYVIQDADDLSYPTRIENLVKTMEQHPQLAGIFSGYDMIINNQQVAPLFRDKSIEQCRKDIEYLRMPSHDPTAMFRMSKVSAFQYDPELSIGQGWDYILRVGEVYPLMVIGKCLYSYRINQFSNTRLDRKHRVEKIQVVLKKAYQRRGIPFSPAVNKRSSQVNIYYGVVPHFMESVIDLKRSGNILGAFKVALKCLLLQPATLIFYKPFIYAIVPLRTIILYRRLNSTS